MNSKKYINVTIQLEPEVLEAVDAKAGAQDLNRSQFFRRLVKQDLTDAQNDSQPAKPAPEAVAA